MMMNRLVIRNLEKPRGLPLPVLRPRSLRDQQRDDHPLTGRHRRLGKVLVRQSRLPTQRLRQSLARLHRQRLEGVRRRRLNDRVAPQSAAGRAGIGGSPQARRGAERRLSRQPHREWKRERDHVLKEGGGR